MVLILAKLTWKWQNYHTKAFLSFFLKSFCIFDSLLSYSIVSLWVPWRLPVTVFFILYHQLLARYLPWSISSLISLDFHWSHISFHNRATSHNRYAFNCILFFLDAYKILFIFDWYYSYVRHEQAWGICIRNNLLLWLRQNIFLTVSKKIQFTGDCI
jgi:hypothetical protein